jgi:antitoxin YefM
MQITSYSNFRQNLKLFLDKVFVNHDPLFVTRTNGEDVVVLSKTDYESMMETLHLLGNPNNAKRLIDSIKELEDGKGIQKKLIEE